MTRPFTKNLLIDGLFEGGRMAVGAISVVYLNSRGLSLEHIALLKIVQSLVLMFGELPTGLFADVYGSRRSLLAGAFSSAIGLALFSCSGLFIIFILAEIFTALALCFWSGAYEAYVIDRAHLKSEDGSLDSYFHLNESTNQISVLAMGWLGGLVATSDYRFAYALAVALVMGSFFILLSDPKENYLAPQHVQDHATRSWLFKMSKQLKETFRFMKGHPQLAPFFLANILIQFSIQPLLHYWQPAFLHLAGVQKNSILLGNVFFSYCATSIILSLAFSKLSRKFSKLRSPFVTLVLFFMFSCFYLSFAKADSYWHALIMFSALQGFLSLSRTSLGIRLNEVIPDNFRASILSSVGFVSRLGMMLALLSIARLLKTNESGVQVLFLMQIFALLSLTLLALLFLGIIYKKRKAVTS